MRRRRPHTDAEKSEATKSLIEGLESESISRSKLKKIVQKCEQVGGVPPELLHPAKEKLAIFAGASKSAKEEEEARRLAEERAAAEARAQAAAAEAAEAQARRQAEAAARAQQAIVGTAAAAAAGGRRRASSRSGVQAEPQQARRGCSINVAPPSDFGFDPQQQQAAYVQQVAMQVEAEAARQAEAEAALQALRATALIAGGREVRLQAQALAMAMSGPPPQPPSFFGSATGRGCCLQPAARPRVWLREARTRA